MSKTPLYQFGSVQNKDLYQKSSSLIENWRYQFDVSSTVKTFIADWAFRQSGLYPVNDEIVDKKEFRDVSIPLTHVLAELMMKGESDPIAYILNEFCSSDNKHHGYFPTPMAIGNLVSQIVMSDAPSNGEVSMYEPCCGSAGLILQKIELAYKKYLHLDDPLGGVTIVVEDISGVVLNAFFLQFAYKLNYLEAMGGKPALPKNVKIAQIDVLTRKVTGNIYYEMSSPKNI